MSLMHTTTNLSWFSTSHPITCCLRWSSGTARIRVLIWESCASVTRQLHLLSSSFIFASKFVHANFYFLFLWNKRTFELETLQINITLVLPRAKIFSEFWSNRNIWKWWNLFKIWILTNLCFIKRRKHFTHKSDTCVSSTCKVSRSNILLFERNKKYITRILVQIWWPR